MDIYDKTQAAFREYEPESGSVKQYKMTMALVGTALILLAALLITVPAFPGLLMRRACTYALYGVSAALSAFIMIFGSNEKKLLRSPKAEHDFQFCLYRSSRATSAGGPLIKMAEANLRNGQTGRAADALRAVSAETLNPRQRKRYDAALAETETGAPDAAYITRLKALAERRAGLYSSLQAVLALIFIISVAAICLLIFFGS